MEEEEEEKAPTGRLGFPALTRAKQRFLLRQQVGTSAPEATPPDPTPTTDRRSHPPEQKQQRCEHALVATSHTAKSSQAYHQLLESVHTSLENELRVLGRDADAIHAEIGSAHQQTVLDLDALAASLLLLNHIQDTTPPVTASAIGNAPTPAHRSEEDAADSAAITPAVTSAAPVAKKKSDAAAPQLRDSLRHHESEHYSTSPPRQPPPTPTTRQRTHVATLALRAVSVLTLQRCVRRFLYARLDPSGKPQFALAKQLRVRVTVSRPWKRWKAFVCLRQCTRVECAAAAERLSAARACDVSRAIAEQVRASDGKFAFAKRFSEAKLLCRTLRLWLLATATLSASSVA